MVGKATPDRGGTRKSPDGVDPKTSGWASKRTRKTQRDGHNSWGQNMKFMFGLQHPLTCKPLNRPFRTLQIKWEVKILSKKSSCFLSSCVFLHASVFDIVSLLMLNDDVDDYLTLVLYRCVVVILSACICICICIWVYNSRITLSLIIQFEKLIFNSSLNFSAGEAHIKMEGV